MLTNVLEHLTLQKLEFLLTFANTLLLLRFITSRFTRAMGSRPGTDDIQLDASGNQELIWAYRKK
jgi:hypothetical protein